MSARLLALVTALRGSTVPPDEPWRPRNLPTRDARTEELRRAALDRLREAA